MPVDETNASDPPGSSEGAPKPPDGASSSEAPPHPQDPSPAEDSSTDSRAPSSEAGPHDSSTHSGSLGSEAPPPAPDPPAEDSSTDSDAPSSEAPPHPQDPPPAEEDGQAQRDLPPEEVGGLGVVVFSALMLVFLGLTGAVYVGLGGAAMCGLLAHDLSYPLHGLGIPPSDPTVHIFWIHTGLGTLIGGVLGVLLGLIHLVLAGMLLGRVPGSRDLTVALGVLYLPTGCLPVGGILIGLMFTQGAEDRLGPFYLPEALRD